MSPTHRSIFKRQKNCTFSTVKMNCEIFPDIKIEICWTFGWTSTMIKISISIRVCKFNNIFIAFVSLFSLPKNFSWFDWHFLNRKKNIHVRMKFSIAKNFFIHWAGKFSYFHSHSRSLYFSLYKNPVNREMNLHTQKKIDERHKKKFRIVKILSITRLNV